MNWSATAGFKQRNEALWPLCLEQAIYRTGKNREFLVSTLLKQEIMMAQTEVVRVEEVRTGSIENIF